MTPTRNRGEVWVANLNPRFGTEPGKSRPVLIIQAQGLLDAEHPSTLVVPLTTRLSQGSEILRLRLKAGGGLRHDSDLLTDQIRAIDNERFTDGPLLRLDDDFMARIDDAIRKVLDLL